jgi:hypothetical protein
MSEKLDKFIKNLIELQEELPEKTRIVLKNITSLPFMYHRKTKLRCFLFWNGLGFKQSKLIAEKLIKTNELFHSFVLEKSREIHAEITKEI